MYISILRGATAYEFQLGRRYWRWCFLRGGRWWSGWFWWAQLKRFSAHRESTIHEQIDVLIAEYKQWCEDQVLPHWDAVELLIERGHSMSLEQRTWLAEFIDRWDATMRGDAPLKEFL